MELERHASRLEVSHHADDRRYADAGGEQERFLPRVHQLEVVPWLVDEYALPGLEVVHGPGATSPSLVQPHSQYEAVDVLRAIAQRVLTHQPVGEHHADVR